ncbi:TetR/AcrR family transcriptional regulator [Methylobacillus arboreus]|uniref:TetR/AcrR family transcriptional regulator n=1 Tax=Methylobacillus arboreus TaxID=755170 RepID=UPI001E5AC6B0|nr:TetR/AcrR family transcriptional regulator [Methylobacillus arboreus]MCB5190759.1 TetR/AcrR family transcriptional regulator [Methylobacillus arboreus]
MPRRVKTPEQRQHLKMLILDAARQLFVERGIEAVSMREIAKRTAYSPTTIYLHFVDKNDLLQTLCDHDFRILSKDLQSIHTDASQDAVEQLQALCRAYSRYALTYPNHYRFMFMTPKPVTSKDKSKVHHGNVEQDAYALLRFMVKQAFEQQVFRPELHNIELIAQTLWAGIHGVCALQISMADDDWVDWQPIEQRVTLMQDTMIQGLTRPHPAH